MGPLENNRKYLDDYTDYMLRWHCFKYVGLNIKSPFLIALGIGFVDLLPILGSGTAMLPWGIIEIIMGDVTLGIAIIGLLMLLLMPIIALINWIVDIF